MPPRPPSRDPVDVTPEETLRRHTAAEVQLVDVREDHEVRAGRIPGARHIGLQQLAAEADSLEAGRPIIFYCRVGARSAMAAEAFRRAGHDAWSMAGGLQAWVDRALPLEPHDGVVADH
jgi:rhodanese-related sulfurtransferase